MKTLLILWSLLGLTGSTALAQDPGPAPGDQKVRDHVESRRRVALVIGITGFQPGWAPLENCHIDAIKLALALADPAVGAFDQVLVVGNADLLAQELRRQAPTQDIASRIQILPGTTSGALSGHLETFQRRAAGADLALLYVSSHGYQHANGKRYLVTSDTVYRARVGGLDEGHTLGFDMSRLKTAMRGLKSKEWALIKALCDGEGPGAPLQPTVLAVDPYDAGRADAVIGAYGAAYQDRQFQDHFTHLLVEALRSVQPGSPNHDRLATIDRNQDGGVSAYEAFKYAVAHLDQLPGREQQHMAYSGAALDLHEVMLTPRLRDPVLSYVQSLNEGRPYRVAPTAGPKGDTDDGMDGPTLDLVVLEPGFYWRQVIQERDTDRVVYRGSFRVRPGETLSLDRLAKRTEFVTLYAWAGARVWADPELAAHVLGPGPLVGVRLSLPVATGDRTWMLDADVSGGQAQGQTQVFGTSHDTTTTILSGTLGVRGTIRTPRFELSAGPVAGYTALKRVHEATGAGPQVTPLQLVTPVVGARLAVDWMRGTHWVLGGSAQAQVNGVEIDGVVQARSDLQGSFHIGRRLR